MKKNVLFLLMVGFISQAAQAGDIFDNVYYKLYQRRHEIAEIQVKKQQVQVEQDERDYKRYKYLMERNAIAVVKYETYVTKYKLSQLILEDLKAKAAEAKAMLDIVVDRVELGLDMPVCPSVP